MLKYFITSKAKRGLLKLFLTSPDKAFYTREIARLTREPLNAVRRELGNLEKAGLVKSYRQGNLKYYRVVKEFPLYSELKKIIYTTIGLGDYLREKISLDEQIEIAFIYGSVARDQETSRSDIDLFIIGDIDEMDLHHQIAGIEKEIGREINYTPMTKKEFLRRIKTNDLFIRRLLKEEKVLLKGSLDDLR